MDSREINGNQLMALMVLFLIASAMLSNVGGDAGPNVWIVILISTSLGIFLYLMYCRISKLNNYQGLSNILRNTLGKFLGTFVLFSYAVFFFIRCLMVGNALTDMAQQSLMIGADQRGVMNLFLIVIVFSSLYGFKIIGRSSEIFLAVLIGALIPFFVTVLYTGVFKPINLVPILAHGLKGLEHDILRVFFFPFGEILVFLMFFHYIPKNQKNDIKKKGCFGILIASFLMIAVDATTLGILGPDLTKNFQYPFYNAMQLAGLRGLHERLDPLAGIIILLSSYIKSIVYYYATILAFESLSVKFNFKWVLGIVTVLIYLLAPYVRLEQYKRVHLDILPLRIYPIFQLAIPLLLWLISEIKFYKREKKIKKDTMQAPIKN